MTAARLDKLARRADTMHADGLTDEDYADLRDLARCARAIGRLKRAGDSCGRYLWSFSAGPSWATLEAELAEEGDVCLGPIEAVEAAGEVTNADKG